MLYSGLLLYIGFRLDDSVNNFYLKSYMDRFITIKKNSEGRFDNKGSKFLTRLFKISSEEEVKNVLSEVKNMDYDATHIVWAYRLLTDNGIVEMCSDSGEPKNSSGPPVLNTLRSKSIVNVLATVSRWYGGTKLGIPGLIEAYSSSTLDAIGNNNTIFDYLKKRVDITIGYDKLGKIKSLVRKYKAWIVKSEYGEKIDLEIDVRKGLCEEFIKELKDIIHFG